MSLKQAANGAMMALNPWIPYQKSKDDACLRLFCFPYAGGSASIFTLWPKEAPATIEICSVQLPGRETRRQEAPVNRLALLLPQLEAALRPLLDKPFAFFGHSMGAILAFELARRLGPQAAPRALFLSACPAPGTTRLAPLHQLPQAEFVAALQERYPMMDQGILQDPELLQLFLPVLRADLALYETYVYAAGVPLSCPIHVFGGLQDHVVRRAHLAAWQPETTGDFTQRMFPGDHFF